MNILRSALRNGKTVLAHAIGSPRYRFTKDWVTGNEALWSRVLKPYLGRPGAEVLEIGSFEGGSTIWFLDNVLTARDGRITCIDTFAGPYEETFDENISRSGRADKVIKLKGLSHKILRQMIAEPKFDVVYVDGSHEAICTLNDAVLSWDLLKVGGTLLFDDYSTWRLNSAAPAKPKTAIDAFIEIYLPYIKVHEIGRQVVIEKVRCSDAKMDETARYLTPA